MKRILLLSLLIVTGLFAKIEIENAYVREVPPTMPNSAIFMKIENRSNKIVNLIKAESNIAKNVELHTHTISNGMMKMYQVEKIAIEANSETALQPGGFHIMLIGLNKKLKENDIVEVKLIFSNGEETQIKAPVKKVQSMMMHHKNHHGMKH